MRSLVEILRNSPTDKLQHGFAEFYDNEFGTIREDVSHMLEIGIAVGGSIIGWLEFFPNAWIYALDNNPQAVKTTTHPVFSGYEDRLIAGCVDVGIEWELRDWLHKKVHDSFDIVIDDGSHQNSDIMNAWKILWPRISWGGFYIIEDTQVPEAHPLEFFGRDILFYVTYQDPPCIVIRKRGKPDGLGHS